MGEQLSSSGEPGVLVYWDLPPATRHQYTQMMSPPIAPAGSGCQGGAQGSPDETYELYLDVDESQRRADIIQEILGGNWSRHAIDETGDTIGSEDVKSHDEAVRFSARMKWLLESLAECERAGADRRDRSSALRVLFTVVSPFVSGLLPPSAGEVSAEDASAMTFGYWQKAVRSSARGTKDSPFETTEVVTLKGAAERVGIDDRTVRRNVRAGKCPDYDGRGHVRASDGKPRVQDFWFPHTFEATVRAVLSPR